MGATRFLLATAVVLIHCGGNGIFGFKPLSSVVAVQSFFMISGFYMALILTQKYYGPGSYKLFLSNRLLRLYPMYWVVAIASYVLWLVAAEVVGKAGPLGARAHLDLPAFLFVRLTDITIVGQDLILFLAADSNGSLYWTENFREANKPFVLEFMLVSPAWSLSLEIMFYLIAPFLVRRSTGVIAAIVAASLALRAYIYLGLGLNIDPWFYRFFPTELAFFLAGALAYRMYVWWQTLKPAYGVSVGITLFYLAVSLAYQLIPDPEFMGIFGKMWPFHLLTWFSIPWLFMASERSRVDRYIGELSYPMYISHFFVMWVVHAMWKFAKVPSETPWVVLSVLVCTVITGIAMNNLIGVPLERYRQGRVKAAKAKAAAQHAAQQTAQQTATTSEKTADGAPAA